MHIIPLTILRIFLFTYTIIFATYPALQSADHLSINCGSNAASTALGGREWLGDLSPKFPSSVTVEGSPARSIVDQDLKISGDPVPYRTARVSRSQFSYSFRLNPGQKFIRLHFNPASYGGFERFNDLFTVEAGRFTLLANFSASVTADALAVDTFAKEFCVIILENQPLNIVFSPAASLSEHNYAFINGIEIISVPSYLDYCHGGDIGVQVVGRRSVIYVDSSSALELVHRQNIKWGSVSSGDDISAMFGMWATIVKEKANNVANMTWRISVDVGFRYLIRIHFCELGLKMLEAGHKDFRLVIDQMIVSTSADIVRERGNHSMLLYKNYMVMVEGHKQEGKRDIFISLKSDHVFLDIHGPLEGFEVFKLSNHDNSLASPNPQPQRRDSSFRYIQIILSVIGRRNAIATVVFAAICVVNIIAHMLQQIWGVESVEEEEDIPSARTKRLCRQFSLAEVQSITDNFYDAFVIGKGGFGKVYKGIIDNGEVTVAIKRLKRDSKQGKREFWTEVETLSELRHINLVPLIGYCNEQQEMILMYEYMPCGTLADHIHKLARKNKAHHPLSWKQRLKICIGAGRGLDYLHTGHGIIHRDIKASNILLDEKFVAKVSDFGLAKIELENEFQSQASTNLKGTFGYIDPDYFRTRKLTTKSDIYSFGVVLLEVLCGRPAVEPWAEEDKRSLTMWARDSISEGQVDRILAPSLREEISPASLKTFLRIVEKCLLDEPKKRPAIANVVIKLEYALEQQENAESLVPKQITSVSDVFSSITRSQEDNMNYVVPNERTNVADVLPQKENVRSSEPNEITNHADDMPYTDRSQHMKASNLSPIEEISTRALPGDDRTILSMSARLTTASSSVQNVNFQPRDQIDSNMISSGKRDERKTVMHKLSRKLWPWDALWKTGKSSKKKNMTGHALSAPIQRRTSSMASRNSTILGGSRFTAASGSGETSPSTAGQMLPHPNLRIFSFAELKAATRNFRSDTVVGEGGFGKVYKGWLDEKYPSKAGTGTLVAIKRLSPESYQGVREWQSEVNFLGRLSHPNLVKLLGYGWENQILFLVYEYLPKGSLENHLFRRGSPVHPLSWDMRLKILIGASRGLAFLHSVHVIYRDFKTSNILLDESYLPKLSDFGLAKMGPTAFDTHVSTQVMGTHGYAAPEYIMTGHLYVKSDVYSFGVVLVEMLTGLRAVDRSRPSGKQNLLDWIKPHLSNDRKMKEVIDTRLEGIYPPRSALLLARLSLSCLESDPKNRPSMQEVVETLERMDAAVEKPRQPVVRFRHQATVQNI